ncbi:MAG: right-handed parallel beta-helix repeat-containing protein [Planctomycetes bacterium]|nr:right-handed parallel beta-helix repeat-containing protein [Planctomycetota bacterium]
MPHSTDGVTVLSSWGQLLGTLVVLAWFLGSVAAAVRLARGYLVVFGLRRSLRTASVEMQRLSRNVARQLGLRKTPEVFESKFVPTPLMMGLRRPIVVMPTGIKRQASPQQIEGMLVHELAHIARRDQWVGLLQRMASVLFWWQPLAILLSSRLSAVREELCDNHVIRQQGGGFEYAQTLVDMAGRVALCGPLPATVGLLENSHGLEARVTRLLDANQNSETRLSLQTAAAVGAFSILAATLLVVTTIRVVHASPDEGNTKSAANIREIRVHNSDQLLRAARTAKPGTIILLEPGTYRGGLTLNNLRGTAESPIVIKAADPNKRPIIEGGNSCLHLVSPAHVELRDLVFQGARANGLNIDDGGSRDTPAHHVVLHNLAVRDIGSDRNHDGIKLSGLDDFRVENCTVERWGKKGSGIDMVGCHRGIITGSTFRDGDKIFGNAVQMKGGSRDITVSYCRFENAGGRAVNIGGSTGLAYFRPKPEGFEAKDITVEDCTFIGSMAPIAFVGVDGANVHHNTFYRPTRWVMRILQENQHDSFVPSRNARFTHNIIALRADEISSAVNIGPQTAPETFKFSDNFWYCIDRHEKTRKLIQLPTSESNGIYGQDPKFKDASRRDLTIRADSPAADVGPRKPRKK